MYIPLILMTVAAGAFAAGATAGAAKSNAWLGVGFAGVIAVVVTWVYLGAVAVVTYLEGVTR